METKIQNGDQLIEIEQINKTTMKTKKKLSRGMHVFSVVMFMLRRRRRRKSFNTGFWRRVVDSVRKVHSEITIMPSSTIVLPPPPPPPLSRAGPGPSPVKHSSVASNASIISGPALPTPPVKELGLEGGDDDDDDDDDDDVPETIKEVFTVASSSSSSGISGYGSALSLRDLGFRHDNDDDDDDDTDDDDCYSDVDGGDEMIDQKAEEFIVKFYEQMKMQNEVYNTQRYKAKGINIAKTVMRLDKIIRDC